MTHQIAMPDDAPPYNPRYGDAFVIFSVTVLSCAIGAWLLQRLGLALWAGMGAALAVYAVLLSLHLVLRRSLTAGAVEAAPPPVARRKPPPPPPVPAPAGPPSKSVTDEATSAGATLPLPASPAEELARWAESAPADAAKAADELPTPRSATPFSFRPSREPDFVPPLPSGLATPSLGAPPSRLGASRPEISVDFVEESIKKLADALNGATPGEKPAAPAGRTDETEDMIGRSIAALQKAARSMHSPVGAGAPDQVSAWWPTSEPSFGPELSAPRRPPPSSAPPQLNPQLARIAEAVAAERMEVLLEPIHALVEGRPRHFEISMRLLTADGAALEQHELSRALQGSGLMPRIDAARMARAARVAGRLGQRGRQGAVLTTMAGESLTDQSFIDAAAGGPGGNMTLVLAFAQREVRTFTPAHLQALSGLADLGFRFGLEAVTDLDMDFAALQQMGFQFVELDAPVFLDGLPCDGGRVPASDICRHLADYGLSLIVGRIEDDWLLARILGFGVLFGKGTLFGGPRLVKDEVVAGTSAA